MKAIRSEAIVSRDIHGNDTKEEYYVQSSMTTVESKNESSSTSLKGA
jgi:hypothetical protein